MGILSGNPKHEPMHYGEIYAVWQYSMAAKGALSCFQLYKNHAGDNDLKNMIEDFIQEIRQQIKECDTLLTDNGITPSSMLPERPQESLNNIPVGARFSDQEIAAHLSADVSMSLVGCSTIIGQCIREDIAALFAKYHTTKLALGGRMLRLNKEKGWLIPPPLQLEKKDPVEV